MPFQFFIIICTIVNSDFRFNLSSKKIFQYFFNKMLPIFCLFCHILLTFFRCRRGISFVLLHGHDGPGQRGDVRFGVEWREPVQTLARRKGLLSGGRRTRELPAGSIRAWKQELHPPQWQSLVWSVSSLRWLTPPSSAALAEKSVCFFI